MRMNAFTSFYSYTQVWPKKVSNYQMIKNRIKACQ